MATNEQTTNGTPPLPDYAIWWNQLTPDERLEACFARHRGADDPQYRAHMKQFSTYSYSQLQFSGQISVKIMFNHGHVMGNVGAGCEVAKAARTLFEQATTVSNSR